MLSEGRVGQHHVANSANGIFSRGFRGGFKRRLFVPGGKTQARTVGPFFFFFALRGSTRG